MWGYIMRNNRGELVPVALVDMKEEYAAVVCALASDIEAIRNEAILQINKLIAEEKFEELCEITQIIIDGLSAVIKKNYQEHGEYTSGTSRVGLFDDSSKNALCALHNLLNVSKKYLEYFLKPIDMVALIGRIKPNRTEKDRMTSIADKCESIILDINLYNQVVVAELKKSNEQCDKIVEKYGLIKINDKYRNPSSALSLWYELDRVRRNEQEAYAQNQNPLTQDNLAITVTPPTPNVSP